MTKMEKLWYKKVLRLSSRKIKVWLHGDKTPSRVWSNYSLARGIRAPIQRMPKVGHWSVPKGEQ